MSTLFHGNLFHGDLLNFGTIIIALMIAGGVFVALTMLAQSAWTLRRRPIDRKQPGTNGTEPTVQDGKAELPKSA